MVLFAEFQNDYSCRRMYYDPSSKVTKTVIALDVVKSDEVYSQPIYYDDGTSYVMWKLSLDDVQDKLKAIEGDVTPGVIIKTLDIKTKNKD